MNKKLFKISRLLFALFLTFFSAVSANVVLAGGGGRAPITVLSPGVAGGKAAEIVATVYKDNDMKLSIGEKGFFRIKNAQGGQNCITKNDSSNDQGKIYGSCSSPTTGEMEVYIHFPDKVEDAYPYKVSFVEKSQEKEATAQVQANQKKTASSPCGSGLVSYGWDPANGKSCEPFHFNAWTAYCGNGYQENVQLDRCIHANELSNDWKKRAEEICNNPRCDVKPAKPTVTASPTVKTSSSPSPKSTVQPSVSPSPSPTATASASPVASPQVEEPEIKEEEKPQGFFSIVSKIGQGISNFFKGIFKRES